MSLLRRSLPVLAVLMLAHPAAGAAPPKAKPAAAVKPPPKPAAAKPAPKVLSAFEQEQQMTPAALIRRWKADVAIASKRFGVPVTWINAVMRMESGGRTMLSPTQRMVSDKGAMGIMQLMPGTWQEMRQQYALGGDPFNTHDNIHAGAAYLRWLKGKYGYPAMFSAYNAGPGTLENSLAKGTPLPLETRLYAAGIGRILNDPAVGDGAKIAFAKFTRPDGTMVEVDPVAVRSIHTAAEGEYAPGVQAIINMGVLKQGVREDAATVTAALRQRGSKI
jgi:soluble lytic murein transglycosylase-like protein